MAAPNIVNVATITGKTAVADLTTTAATSRPRSRGTRR